MGQVKNIHGPYLQNITATEATIVWEADKPSIGWVELAPDDGSHFYATERKKFFDCTNGVKNTSLIHTVKLSGLKPGTNYRYRIYSQEVLSHQGIFVNYDGRIAASNVYSKQPLQFQTLDPKKTETSFVVLNDIHGKSEAIAPLM
ncbi:MAG: fibronectin type III domain-containing protein, partial [Bacteroidaceae bacterium]|nr:fibronectin type III domain-containing protein [Bacteroidaceae bacterium]